MAAADIDLTAERTPDGAEPVVLTGTSERARLALLEDLGLFDAPPDDGLDAVTEMAAELCGQPMSLISLVGERRQYFASHHGLDLTETEREISFCSHAIDPDRSPNPSDEPSRVDGRDPLPLFEVPDTHTDQRFRANPLVTGPPHLRFYAGVPLRPTGDLAVGTLCVLGPEPNRLSHQQRRLLLRLAAVAEQLLRLPLLAKKETLANRRADRRETQYRYLAENTAEMVLIHDDELTVRYVSPNVIEFLGYHQGEPWGMDAGRPVLDTQGRHVLISTTKSLTPTQPTATCRLTVYRKDGIARDVEVFTRAIFADSAQTEFHSTVRDISHLLAYERDLADAHRSLHAMVEHRTQLIRGIAHDLAAPLAALRVTAESLTSQLAGDGLARQAARLQSFAQSAEAFAGDLRRVADPETTEYTLAPRLVPVRPIVEQALEQVAEIPDGNLTADLAEVDAFVDPHALSRVITNLVTNAHRHTPAGTPIRVSLTGTPDVVTLQVADEGYGIPMQARSRVLQPYVTTTTTGSGLGLAIANTLVQGLDGRLTISDNRPRGALITVELPAAEPAPVPSPEAPARV